MGIGTTKGKQVYTHLRTYKITYTLLKSPYL
jgi:hypothetical protein